MNKIYIYLIVTVLMGSLGGGVWYLVHKNAVLEADNKAAWSAVESYAGHIHEQSVAFDALNLRFDEARGKEARDNEIFAEHDMSELVKEKPGLMASRVTDGLNGLFHAINQASGSGNHTSTETR